MYGSMHESSCALEMDFKMRTTVKSLFKNTSRGASIIYVANVTLLLQ